MLETSKKQPPTYRRIQSNLRKRVMQGEWQNGQPLPSRRALAEEFGTTRITVEKAVRELEREGLLQSVHGRGTFVYRDNTDSNTGADGTSGTSNMGAVAAIPKATFTIGVLQGHTVRYAEPEPLFREHFFFGPLFQGICNVIDEYRCNLFVVRVGDKTYAEVTQDRTADGWIVVSPSLEDVTQLNELQRADTPFITLANTSLMVNCERPIPFVEAANQDGVRQAIGHLHTLGHRRIAHANMGLNTGDCYARLQGFLTALSELGLPLSPDHLLLYPMHSPDHFGVLAKGWITHLLKAGNLPTALFVSDYMAAVEVLQTLRDNDLRVPEDISLVGYDDPVSAAHLSPPLTVVRQPLFEMGQRAASRLIDHLMACHTHPDAPSVLSEAEFIPVSLVVRSSTCPPRPEDNDFKGVSI